VTDAPAVAVASMPEDKKEALMARLRQAISDEEECSVRTRSQLERCAHDRFVSRYSRSLESPIVVIPVSTVPCQMSILSLGTFYVKPAYQSLHFVHG